MSLLNFALVLSQVTNVYFGEALVMHSSKNSDSDKPHIVYILTDDLGYGSVGYNDAVQVKTPYIDKLAKAGVKLDAFYTSPICSPSRFSLMTGRAGFKCPTTESAGNGDIIYPLGIDLAYTMLPASLQKVGYATHLLGKWHLGAHREEYVPTSRGFDTFFGFYGGSEGHFQQDTALCGDPADVRYRLFDFSEPELQDQGYNDEMFVQRAIEIIGNHTSSEPLFMLLSLQNPHHPFEAPERLAKKYGDPKTGLSKYNGMVSSVDESVQAVHEALVSKGMYENTFLIFSSDNGADKWPSGPGGFPTPDANGPFHGSKGQFFEGGVRVPAFVAGGILPDAMAGKILSGVIGIEDMYATISHLAGAALDTAGPKNLDSLNQWPYLAGEMEEGERDRLLLHIGAEGDTLAVRYKHYKLMAMDPATTELKAHTCSIKQPCLFDLDENKEESNQANVARDHPEVIAEIKEWLEKEYPIQAKHRSLVTEIPEAVASKWQKRACKVWAPTDFDPKKFSHEKKFIGPWATQEDEVSFMSQLRKAPDESSKYLGLFGHALEYRKEALDKMKETQKEDA